MSKPKFTIYEADRSGQCWDMSQTDDPAYALKCLDAGRAARPGNCFMIGLTDDPERGNVEDRMDEFMDEEPFEPDPDRQREEREDLDRFLREEEDREHGK